MRAREDVLRTRARDISGSFAHKLYVRPKMTLQFRERRLLDEIHR